MPIPKTKKKDEEDTEAKRYMWLPYGIPLTKQQALKMAEKHGIPIQKKEKNV